MISLLTNSTEHLFLLSLLLVILEKILSTYLVDAGMLRMWLMIDSMLGRSATGKRAIHLAAMFLDFHSSSTPSLSTFRIVFAVQQGETSSSFPYLIHLFVWTMGGVYLKMSTTSASAFGTMTSLAIASAFVLPRDTFFVILESCKIFWSILCPQSALFQLRLCLTVWYTCVSLAAVT